jgi:hypothetical protein
MRFYAAVCAILMLTAIRPAAGDRSRLAIRVSPAVAIAPADLTVRATVEADAANRSVEIIAESDVFFRSSEIPLNGDEAPRTSRIEFKGLPGGIYQVRAVLKGPGDEAIATVAREINIVASPWER